MGRFFAGIELSWWSVVPLVVFFILFVGLVVYTYLPSRRATHIRHGEIPLEDEKSGR